MVCLAVLVLMLEGTETGQGRSGRPCRPSCASLNPLLKQTRAKCPPEAGAHGTQGHGNTHWTGNSLLCQQGWGCSGSPGHTLPWSSQPAQQEALVPAPLPPLTRPPAGFARVCDIVAAVPGHELQRRTHKLFPNTGCTWRQSSCCAQWPLGQA